MLVLEGLRDGAVIPGMGDALNPGIRRDGCASLRVECVSLWWQRCERVAGGRNVSCRVSVGTGMSGWRMTFDGVCRRGSYRRLEAAVRRDKLSSEEAR